MSTFFMNLITFLGIQPIIDYFNFYSKKIYSFIVELISTNYINSLE